MDLWAQSLQSLKAAETPSQRANFDGIGNAIVTNEKSDFENIFGMNHNQNRAVVSQPNCELDPLHFLPDKVFEEELDSLKQDRINEIVSNAIDQIIRVDQNQVLSEGPMNYSNSVNTNLVVGDSQSASFNTPGPQIAPFQQAVRDTKPKLLDQEAKFQSLLQKQKLLRSAVNAYREPSLNTGWSPDTGSYVTAFKDASGQSDNRFFSPTATSFAAHNSTKASIHRNQTHDRVADIGTVPTSYNSGKEAEPKNFILNFTQILNCPTPGDPSLKSGYENLLSQGLPIDPQSLLSGSTVSGIDISTYVEPTHNPKKHTAQSYGPDLSNYAPQINPMSYSSTTSIANMNTGINPNHGYYPTASQVAVDASQYNTAIRNEISSSNVSAIPRFSQAPSVNDGNQSGFANYGATFKQTPCLSNRNLAFANSLNQSECSNYIPTSNQSPQSVSNLNSPYQSGHVGYSSAATSYPTVNHSIPQSIVNVNAPHQSDLRNYDPSIYSSNPCVQSSNQREPANFYGPKPVPIAPKPDPTYNSYSMFNNQPGGRSSDPSYNPAANCNTSYSNVPYVPNQYNPANYGSSLKTPTAPPSYCAIPEGYRNVINNPTLQQLSQLYEPRLNSMDRNSSQQTLVNTRDLSEISKLRQHLLSDTTQPAQVIRRRKSGNSVSRRNSGPAPNSGASPSVSMNFEKQSDRRNSDFGSSDSAVDRFNSIQSSKSVDSSRFNDLTSNLNLTAKAKSTRGKASCSRGKASCSRGKARCSRGKDRSQLTRNNFDPTLNPTANCGPPQTSHVNARSQNGAMNYDSLTSQNGVMHYDSVSNPNGTMHYDSLTSQNGVMHYDSFTNPNGVMLYDSVTGSPDHPTNLLPSRVNTFKQSHAQNSKQSSSNVTVQEARLPSKNQSDISISNPISNSNVPRPVKAFVTAGNPNDPESCVLVIDLDEENEEVYDVNSGTVPEHASLDISDKEVTESDASKTTVGDSHNDQSCQSLENQLNQTETITLTTRLNKSAEEVVKESRSEGEVKRKSQGGPGSSPKKRKEPEEDENKKYELSLFDEMSLFEDVS